MIDTHCHLNSSAYADDYDEVINSAFNSGIDYILVPATNPNDFDKTFEIAEKYDKVYAAIGVHPHEAKSVDAEVLKNIRKYATHKKNIAIGEVGLDFHYNYSSQEVQISVLREQIRIANEFDLPLMLHNRESDEIMLKVLTEELTSNSRGVVHCFSSDLSFLDSILAMNLHVSFTANITFPSVKLDDVILAAPLERIMLETDSPYMTPAPNRGKRNSPTAVKKVAEKIANIKKISIDEVITMTTNNAKKLFNLSALLIFFILSANLYSQNNTYYDYDDDDEEYILDQKELSDPYRRVLGIGAFVGTNTFVEQFDTGIRNVSADGLFTYGASLNYRFMPAFILQASYMYAKNTKNVESLPDSAKNALDPNIHKTAELSVLAMLLPKNMVNFYGIIGVTYMMNKRSSNPTGFNKFYVTDDAYGINTGVGAFVNIDLKTAGTLSVTAEWKLHFKLGKTSLDFDPRINPNLPEYNTPTNVGIFSSVIRGGIIYYMPFL